MDFKKLDLAKMVDNAMRQQTQEELFPWQTQLQYADEIIAQVGAPVKNWSRDQRATQPTGLRPLRVSLAKLLSQLQETYIVGRQDFLMRHPRYRPNRKLTAKDVARWGTSPKDLPPSQEELNEISSDPSWQKHWGEVYGLHRGNPGRSRQRGSPPLKPLHPVYVSIQRWWRTNGLGKFHPRFDADEVLADGTDMATANEEYFNAPARFLLGVMKTLDSRFTVKNARGLYETMRKSEKRPKGD